MATAVQAPDEQRLVLEDIPWKTYLRFLKEFEDRRLRLTYDRGMFEIMTLSHEHEIYSHLLGRFVDTLTEELNIPVKGGRSTTFKRRRRKRGLEPDGCYWIASEPLVRGKDKIDLRRDPSPDLAIEIEVSRSLLNRLGIYAALRIPELWRFDGRSWRALILGADGEYAESERSLAFPFLPLAEVAAFVAHRKDMDETSLVRSFRAWVREQIARGWPSP